MAMLLCLLAACTLIVPAVANLAEQAAAGGSDEVATAPEQSGGPVPPLPAGDLASLQDVVTSEAAFFWHNASLTVSQNDYRSIGGLNRPKPKQPGPAYATRAQTMVHLAMHDAFLGILPAGDPQYMAVAGGNGTCAQFARPFVAPAVYSPLERLRDSWSAIAGAATRLLRDHYPNQRRIINKIVDEWDATFPYSQRGFAYGRNVAAYYKCARDGDGAQTERDGPPPVCEAPPCGGVGPFRVYPDPPYSRFQQQPDPVKAADQPEEPQLLYVPYWGEVKSWGFESVVSAITPLRGPPQRVFDYTADAEKVRALGARESAERSAYQLDTGIFWAYDGELSIGTPHALFSTAIDSMLLALGTRSPIEGLPLCTATTERGVNARPCAHGAIDWGSRNGGAAALLKLWAATNVAMADAAIHAWHEKYKWDFWRPVVGLRAGAPYRRPRLRPTPDWTPYGSPTSNNNRAQYNPPFPAYPSGHATIGTAALRTAEAILNLPEGFTFEMVSDEFNGINKEDVRTPAPRPLKPRVLTVADAVDQNKAGRLYIGVHWEFDSEEGARAGGEIAAQVAAHFPRRADVPSHGFQGFEFVPAPFTG